LKEKIHTALWSHLPNINVFSIADFGVFLLQATSRTSTNMQNTVGGLILSAQGLGC